MESTKTALLLATYNGERYLREQIDSLYAQTFTDWTLYAHDDGSTDGTVEILEEYEREHDSFVLLRYPSQHGSSGNFLSLLQQVDADYYFFSDQDDKWMPHKMACTMQRMQSMEAEGQRPVLVYSDVMVTDSSLNVISESLWKQSGLRPEFLNTFDECAATPFATGCTMLINRRAKDSVLWDKTDKATMHDAFIALCVLKAGGVVSPIREPLMYYRQHEGNVLGAVDASQNSVAYKLRHLGYILRKDYAILRMLHALGYGSVLKFLRYKWLYKKRCRTTRMEDAR